MLKILLPIFIILLPNYGMVSEAQAQKLEVTREFMEGCETGTAPCDPIEILRSHHQEDWLVILPDGTSFLRMMSCGGGGFQLELGTR